MTQFERNLFSLSLKQHRHRSIADVFGVCCAQGFGSALTLVTFNLVVVVVRFNS